MCILLTLRVIFYCHYCKALRACLHGFALYKYPYSLIHLLAFLEFLHRNSPSYQVVMNYLSLVIGKYLHGYYPSFIPLGMLGTAIELLFVKQNPQICFPKTGIFTP